MSRRNSWGVDVSRRRRQIPEHPRWCHARRIRDHRRCRQRQEMAEVVGLLKTVLTELTVLKGELTQVASDIQELKDQVRVLADAAYDMVQPQRAWRSW